jgi:dihydroorotate dehydrogenase
LGTVTPRPQAGNERPRLFRLPDDSALINRMGFNNAGAEALAARLAALDNAGLRARIGVNLGRNRDTPNERAHEDYLAALRTLHPHAAYAVVNISSPNTPGLRALQDRASLQSLLAALRAEESRLAARHGRRVPLVVKVSPDLAPAALEEFAEVVLAAEVDGLIASNTTLSRPGLRSPRRDEVGGLSGRPLNGLALETVGALHRHTSGRMPIVASGGIFSADDAYAMILAGASAVQIYTALIYRGPGVVRGIKRGLAGLLHRDGFSNVAEAVGSEV